MKIRFIHWCIAAAALANLVVFLQPAETPRPAPEPEVGELRSLVLLSELDEPLPQRVQPGEDDPVAGVARVQDSRATGLLENVRVGIAPADVPEAGLTAEAGSGEEVAVDVVAVAGEISGESTVEASPPLELPAPTPRCWLAGPVDDDLVSERMTAAFAAVGYSMDLVLQTVEVAPDHWVYLPTDGTQAEVRRLSRELRQDGIDNFPITDGPLAGSLSLGLFRSQARAEAMRDLLSAQGRPVEIYLRSRFQDQAWIALDDAARIALGWQEAPGAVPGFQGMDIIERDCPENDAP